MEKCKDCDGPKVIHNRIDDIEKTVEGHDTTLYGKNQDGITYKQKECITKKNLWAFFAATLFIFAGIFAVVNTMWADTRDYPETKKKVELASQDVVSLKERVKAIEEWKKEDQDLKKEIIKVLRAVKEEKDERTK
jgi:hypothetical protein